MITLLSFGDSWPAGMELNWDNGEKSFPFLIAERLDMQCSMHSHCATGIPHMVLQLENAIKFEVEPKRHLEKSKDFIALFSLSSPSRSITFRDGEWQEIHSRSDDIYSTSYFKYIHSNELEDFVTNCYILALQKMCQAYNIKDYYVSCWSKLNLYLPGIDKSKFFDEGSISLAEMLGCGDYSSFIQDINLDPKHPTIFPNMCHPNILGHQIIADKLSNWIKT